MQQVIDSNTGAILFKEDESNPTDKRVRILREKVSTLTKRVEKLEKEIEELKKPQGN